MHVRNGGKQCIFSVGRWPVVHTPTEKKIAEACTSDGRGVFRDLGSVVGYWISSFFSVNIHDRCRIRGVKPRRVLHEVRNLDDKAGIKLHPKELSSQGAQGVVL